jgi:L-ascorbate metabolism protein UlaG (beta-lactamase superfamily)
MTKDHNTLYNFASLPLSTALQAGAIIYGMKNLVVLLIGLLIIAVVGFYAFNNFIYNEKQGDGSSTAKAMNSENTNASFQVVPITHASVVLKWDNSVIYADPTGGATSYSGQPKPDIVVITDIHGDHLDPDTLSAVLGDATLIVPQAVRDMLPKDLAAKAQVLANGENTTVSDFNILAIPMYNLPESTDSRHTKGRGNGYVIEKDGRRVYIAGDTDGIPEMRALKNIDVAFVPMNPPFTMDVNEAADAVLAFKPKQVYPYHYRGQAGLSDTEKFKELVNAGDPNIEVTLLNWYPE